MPKTMTITVNVTEFSLELLPLERKAREVEVEDQESPLAFEEALSVIDNENEDSIDADAGVAASLIEYTDKTGKQYMALSITDEQLLALTRERMRGNS